MAEEISMTLNRIYQKHDRRLLTSLFCLSIFMLSFLSGCAGPKQPIIELKVGTPAPDFMLPAVRGGGYELKNLHGKAVLLSFINTQAEAGLDTPDPSRAQIMFLKSMYEQYAPKGLTVFIVDTTQLETGKQPSLDEVINFTYNWQLDTIPVLVDENGLIRDQYGISNLPTTLLIGTDGVIQQRWNNVASSSQLALAIEAIVGAPFYRATSTNATPTVQGISCLGEPLGQAKFSGVGLARPLSDEIWAVDKGQAWSAGGDYPLQWIVLDTSDKAGKSRLHLQVTGNYFNAENFVLIDQILQQLPEDEARGLLGTTDENLPKVYLLTITIGLTKPGCLQVKAIVTDEGAGNTLYNGEMLVTVH